MKEGVYDYRRSALIALDGSFCCSTRVSIGTFLSSHSHSTNPAPPLPSLFLQHPPLKLSAQIICPRPNLTPNYNHKSSHIYPLNQHNIKPVIRITNREMAARGKKTPLVVHGHYRGNKVCKCRHWHTDYNKWYHHISCNAALGNLYLYFTFIFTNWTISRKQL